MKYRLIFLCFLVKIAAYSQSSTALYPFKEGNKWGYIDTSGNVVIKPSFLVAGYFSEGMAAVRENGLYGYINTKGEFIVKPAFDLALPYEQNRAKVYVNGIPYFIDKRGRIIFQHNYKSLLPVGKGGYYIAGTYGGSFALIDASGELVTDTVFSEIGVFSSGVAVVKGVNHNPYKSKLNKRVVYEVGVIDTMGNWIIPFGRYKDIREFKNGFARAELKPRKSDDDDEDKDVIVDASGRQRFVMPASLFDFDYESEGFYDNIAIVSIEDTMISFGRNNATDFMGAIDPDGKLQFSNRQWKRLTPFNNGRAFAFDRDEKWLLIDKRGIQVGQWRFDDILYERRSAADVNFFSNNMAFVKIDDEWKVIDSTGKVISEVAELDEMETDNIYRVGNMLYFQEDFSVEDKVYPYHYGFLNYNNRCKAPVECGYMDFAANDDDLIFAIKEGRMLYFNKQGIIVWQENIDTTKIPQYLNIDYMNRGYYYAYSRYKGEDGASGGWAVSGNKANKVVNREELLDASGLQLILDTTQKTLWQEQFPGIKLYIINSSKDTMYFDAQDSRLYLKLQAQDKNGEWQDIEYLPSSWCGNSYHTLFLASGEMWEFNTPVYQGALQTKIRAQLKYKKRNNDREQLFIYSNEINGSVNPGQFWNKREYYPRGIMDPYND